MRIEGIRAFTGKDVGFNSCKSTGLVSTFFSLDLSFISLAAKMALYRFNRAFT